MAEITVLQMPLFKRTYKKLKLNQKQVVDKAIATIVENPLLGELKRGDTAFMCTNLIAFINIFTCKRRC